MSVNQVSIFVENKPGAMCAMTDVLAANNINMRALSLAETEGFGIVRIIVDDILETTTLLKQEGYITTDRRSGARVALKDDKAVNEKTMQQLRLAVSELRLSGMKEEEILSLVSGLYQEGGAQ